MDFHCPHIIGYTGNTSVTDEYFSALEVSFLFSEKISIAEVGIVVQIPVHQHKNSDFFQKAQNGTNLPTVLIKKISIYRNVRW
jgi:hypothetical protein